MKKTWILALCSALLLGTSTASAITPEEIKTLATIGVSADEMIRAIDRDRTVFRLSVSEILELKRAGIPEEVLRYMLRTPQMFGEEEGTGSESGSTTTTQQPGTDTPDEMTPEERAAFEARQRAEAERLAGEARAAEEAQRRAFAQGILRRAMDLANDGECIPAITTFLDFVQQGNYTRGTDEHYTAWYGIALALSQCKTGPLYQSAAKYLVEVLLEGPEKPFFQQAFWKLREIRQQINYPNNELDDLANFPVVGFSRAFQDEYNYFLGEHFYEYQNYTRALTHFEQVSGDAKDFGKSLYLTGLVQAQNNLFRSAVQSFQNAITSTERNDSDPEVKTLAFLALARIAYEAQQYDAAIYYYRKVPADSPKLATAFYESAWTYFVKGDYGRTLGTFQALHSPFFGHYFYPELWILEATVYVNMCRYEGARDALTQFDAQVAALGVPLKELLRRLRTPEDYYRALLGIAESDPTYAIDSRVISPVLANVEFYNLYRTIQQIQTEESFLTSAQAQLGQFGSDLVAKLGSLRQSRVNEAGIKVQRLLKELEAELADYAVKKTEIEVDLSMEEINRQTRALQGMEEQPDSQDVEIEGSTAIIGSDSMSWPFEGEYWKDAIGGFRSQLRSQCETSP